MWLIKQDQEATRTEPLVSSCSTLVRDSLRNSVPVWTVVILLQLHNILKRVTLSPQQKTHIPQSILANTKPSTTWLR